MKELWLVFLSYSYSFDMKLLDAGPIRLGSFSFISFVNFYGVSIFDILTFVSLLLEGSCE